MFYRKTSIKRGSSAESNQSAASITWRTCPSWRLHSLSGGFCPLWSAIGDKTRRLCLTNILRLGRDIVSVALPVRRPLIKLGAWVLQPKNETRFVFSLQKWLSPLECCHMDWYCQKTIYCLAQSWWNTAIPVATWTDIVKRQFIVLLSPSGTLSHGLILSKGNLLSCSVLVKFCHAIPSSGLILSKGKLLPCSILRRIPVTLSRKNGVSIGTPCHSVSQNGLFGTPLNKQFYKLACPI